MQRRTSAMCRLIIATGLVLACALPAKAAETTLQGTWIATKAEQDGKAADDLVGHRLSLMGNRFEIRSKDDKPLDAAVQVSGTATGARAVAQPCLSVSVATAQISSMVQLSPLLSHSSKVLVNC